MDVIRHVTRKRLGDNAEAREGELCNVLRRALQEEVLWDESERFPPAVVAMCVLVAAGVCSVRDALNLYREMRKGRRAMDIEGDEVSEDLFNAVWTDGWQRVERVVMPGVMRGKTKGKRKEIFQECYVVVVTSLFLTARLAGVLLDQVREAAGDGIVAKPGVRFSRDEERNVQDKAKNSAHIYIICNDFKDLRALHLLPHFELRKPAWISDSIRDQRFKAADPYIVRTHVRPLQKRAPEEPIGSGPKRMKAFRAEESVRDEAQAAREKESLHGFAIARAPITEESRLAPKDAVPSSSPVKIIVSPAPQLASSEANDSNGPLVHKPRHGGWACESRRLQDGHCFPMNEKICNLLGIVQAFYETKKDHFRAVGYQRAIARMKNLEYEILEMADVERLRETRGMGARMERKLGEVIRHGSLKQADAILNNADNVAMRELCDVWGIGPSMAYKLNLGGIKNVAQLREVVKANPFLLDRNQRIGLRLYEDLRRRIPRKEVAELETYVRKQIKKIHLNLNIEVAGSYLRGKENCGDVDILVHGPRNLVYSGLSKLVTAMRKDKVLTDDLVDGRDKYFGVFRFPGRPHGRIDLFAVPATEYPFAILTYTGSAIFNR